MKKIIAVALMGLLAAPWLSAEEEHMVDMADGLNAGGFYDKQNPDSLWSSDLSMPWAKQSAINAFDEAPRTGGIESETIGLPSGGKLHEGGNRFAPGKLINVRAEYSLQVQQYPGSVSWASQKLYVEMAQICPAGFQRIAEWSQPATQVSFFLYYQFSCIAPKQG